MGKVKCISWFSGHGSPLESLLFEVKDKVKLFMELFSAKLEIKDLSGKAIVPAKEVETRCAQDQLGKSQFWLYQCI